MQVVGGERGYNVDYEPRAHVVAEDVPDVCDHVALLVLLSGQAVDEDVHQEEPLEHHVEPELVQVVVQQLALGQFKGKHDQDD